MIAGGAFSVPANAATITIDGSTVTKLSAAVAQVQAMGSGPHVINITTDNIIDDAPVYITQAVTIVGDADGNGNKCDILVDISALRDVSSPAPGTATERAYITVQTTATVEISDLQIHPDEDGVESADPADQKVDAVRLLKALETGTGQYNFRRVFISGSDADNKYVPLDTGDDIYSLTPKKWSGGATGNSVVQASNQGSPGTYGVLFDHCHIGLGKASAMNFITSGAGQRRIVGGVFGHCGTDGIRASGTAVRIQGTVTDRVRVIRSTNISGGDAHAIEAAGGNIPLLEYVDIACFNTANALKLASNGIINGNYIRVLGKYNSGNNAAAYLTGTGQFTLTNSTVVGYGNNNNPYQADANFAGTSTLRDCIFTSQNLGQMIFSRTAAGTNVPVVEYCAIPTDGTTSESLHTSTPLTGNIAESVTPVNSVTVSPNYMLTLEDYDWSDNQGANQPGNGAGNRNVLRPTNTAYAAASSVAGFLTGGAGPAAPASISADIWMLMD